MPSILDNMTKDEKREYLIGELLSGTMLVEFIKVNGELRKMPATLSPNLLPPKPLPSDANEPLTERKINTDVISVYCTDKFEWRSFRIDNVINITPL